MAIVAIFWTFLLSACLLVLWYGRTLERAFLILLVAISAVTLALSAKVGIVEAQHSLFAMDIAILVVILAIMHRSNAYWPVWFAGFHTIIVATGLAHLLLPSAVPGIYINVASFWSLPSLIVLALGSLADNRMRVAALRIPEVRSQAL